MATGTSPFKFEVIEGSGRASSPWLQIPSAVIGRSPFSQSSRVVFRIAQQDARKALSVGRRQPLLDLWSVVLGEIPPVNNALAKWGNHLAANKLTSVFDAHACFRGIKRPAGNDDRGFDFYAFVSNPSTFFVYEPSMGCVIKPMDVPDDLIHVTYVRLDYPEGRPSGKEIIGAGGAIGIVTHWEFVEAEPGTRLPLDSGERYRRQMW